MAEQSKGDYTDVDGEQTGAGPTGDYTEMDEGDGVIAGGTEGEGTYTGSAPEGEGSYTDTQD